MSRENLSRAERRSTRREAALTCNVLVEASDRHLKGHALDVSAHGVRMLSNAEVVRGESVVLTLALPDGRTWVDAHAKVARVEEGLRGGDAGRAIAFEFTDVSEADREALVAATRGYDRPAPRRGVFRLPSRSWG